MKKKRILITLAAMAALIFIPAISSLPAAQTPVYAATTSVKVKFDGKKATTNAFKTQTFKVKDGQMFKGYIFRTGYTMKGWATSKKAKKVVYATNQKVNAAWVLSQKKKTLKLYAVWKANRYTVSFKANGGTGKMTDQSFSYGKSSSLKANAYKKKGYAFAGWNTRKDGKGASYKNKVTIINLTPKDGGKVVLYAQWKKAVYSVAFNANGGKGTMQKQSFTYGKTQKLTANAFTRGGYLFKGWNTKKDGSGKAYADRASVKNLSSTHNATVTLYAQWKKAGSYHVVYDANGGTGEMSVQTILIGTQGSLTKNAFTKKACTFAGWNTKKDGSGKGYADGQAVLNLTTKTNGQVTLYAQWKHVPSLGDETCFRESVTHVCNISTVTEFRPGQAKPASGYKYGTHDENELESDPVYLWCEGTVLYYWTDGELYLSRLSSSLFKGFSDLTFADLSGLNGAYVYKMNNMFEGCTNLTTVRFGTFIAPELTDVSGLFKGCGNMRTANLSGWHVDSLTKIGSMFEGCSGMKEIDLSDVSTQYVRDMSRMFYNCVNLERVWVTNAWSTGSTSESADMFFGCIKIQGGAGTTYEPGHLDADYARADRSGVPGYFSNNEPLSF